VKVRIEYPPPAPPPKIVVEMEINQATALRNYLAQMPERDPSWFLRELKRELTILLRTVEGEN